MVQDVVEKLKRQYSLWNLVIARKGIVSSLCLHFLLFITSKYTIINANLKLINAKIHSFYSTDIHWRRYATICVKGQMLVVVDKHRRFSLGTPVSSYSNTELMRSGPYWSTGESSLGS